MLRRQMSCAALLFVKDVSRQLVLYVLSAAMGVVWLWIRLPKESTLQT